MAGSDFYVGLFRWFRKIRVVAQSLTAVES